VVGGIGTAGTSLGSSELFNTATSTFSAGPNLNSPRSAHNATLLGDGQVLIAAGSSSPERNITAPLATAELYDGETNTFTQLSGAAACPGSAGCMISAFESRSAVLLGNGRVFFSGGSDLDGDSSGKTEIYDPETKTFTAGPLIVPVYGHTAIALDKTSASVVLNATPNPSGAGQSVTFTATISGSGDQKPTGTVAFLEGSTTLGSATLDNGSAAFTTATLSSGTHTIMAQYAGDSYYSPASSAPLVQTVSRAATSTAVASAPNPSNFGQQAVFTVRVTAQGGTPTGSVSLLDGGQPLGSAQLSDSTAAIPISSLSGGPHSITAVYPGDAAFAGSISAVLVQTVTQQPTSTSVTASPNPATLGQSVTLTASTTSSKGQPGGSITFRDGNSVVGTGRLVNGSATLQISTIRGGAHAITASYGGDSVYAPSTSAALSLTVNAASTQTVLSSNLNPSSYSQTVLFSVLVSSGSGTPSGSVVITDGGRTLVTVSLNAGRASFSTKALGVGSHEIVASYSGTASYGLSSSAPVTEIVNAAPTQVALSSKPNPSIQNQPVSLRATVTSTAGSPDGTVTFLDGSSPLGSAVLVQGTAAITVSQLTIGQHWMTANYSGSTNFSSAVSAPLMQTVNRPPPILTSTSVVALPSPETHYGVSAKATTWKPSCVAFLCKY
jgi:hypothetical protein